MDTAIPTGHGPPRARALGTTSVSVLAAGAELGAMVDRLVRREGGVTLTQYEVLCLLAHDDAEPREIARVLGLGSGHLTTVLDGLERGGLVTRNRHEADGRRRRVALTDEGRRRLTWLRELIGAAEARILGEAVDPGEQAVLVDLLTRLRAAIATAALPSRTGGP